MSERHPERLLAIETSCDDTAAAVFEGRVLRSAVTQQQVVHEAYGGVVPELASRDHMVHIGPVVQQALREAGITAMDLGAVAVTGGPGLAGSLLVGLSYAKGMALALDVPFLSINHMEGHLFSILLDHPDTVFPWLALVVSGGHTQLVHVKGPFDYTVLGQTRDDAAGEAFDKVGNLLGLPYPGGPAIDRLAQTGDANFASFPRTHLPGYDWSFSGIKTAVRYYLQDAADAGRAEEMRAHQADLCASFQQAVIDMLVDPVRRAVRALGIQTVTVVGGVSANHGLTHRLAELGREEGFSVFWPQRRFATDNAAMIGIVAALRRELGQTDPLNTGIRVQWPLGTR